MISKSPGSRRFETGCTRQVEKAMAPHSSTLAWRIPWMEEPDKLQSMGSQRVGHDWATSLSLFTFMHWRRNGNPLQCSCLESPRDGGAWWAAVYGVAQSWTRLKWLSSSSTRLDHLPDGLGPVPTHSPAFFLPWMCWNKCYTLPSLVSTLS